MNHGTTPQSDIRPGVGQAPELRCEGRRYAPGHTTTGGGKIHEVGLIGGTFDRFHAGHLALMVTGLSQCSHIEAWITADSMAQSKDPRVNPWDVRVMEMKEALGEDVERVSFHVLEDSHGPAPSHPDATAILCTDETEEECVEINRLRRKAKLPPLWIIFVRHSLAWDGEPISSSRIRAGEIDREGQPWIPSTLLDGGARRVVMTPQIEAELKEPFGELFAGPEDDPSVAMSQVLAHIESGPGPVIAVGDVTARTLQDLGRPADIALIDGLTKREPVAKEAEVNFYPFNVYRPTVAPDTERLYDHYIHTSNPAGCLTAKLTRACRKALHYWKDSRETTLILVDGEEDLAPLLLHPLAPLNAVVLYGQPGKGVVVRWCDVEAKQRCRRLISGFAASE